MTRFRKTDTNEQLDLFTSPSSIMGKRAVKKYTDENPYMQYLCGLSEFTDRPIFDPSLFVTIRKRISEEDLNKMTVELMREQNRQYDQRESDAGEDGGASAPPPPDPLAEKYPDTSPYAFCANNPMRYTDLDGKRILIQDGIDRDLFMKSMSTVFGNYSNYFDFDTNGFLSNNGSLVGMSSLQLDLFAGLNEIIEQDDVTQVVAGKEMILQDVEGNQLAFSTELHGGELTLLMDEVEGIDRNFVLVNPMDNQTIQVMTLVNDFGVGSNTSKSIKYENVQATPTDLIFHGLGHVKYKGQSQDKVIKFHNKARKILNLLSWPSNDYRHGKGYK